MKSITSNVLENLKTDRESASLLFCIRDESEQQLVVEQVVRHLLDIPIKINYKTNPDVFGIWQEHIEGKTIKIEQVHEFIRKVQLKPYGGTHKVGSIMHAEKLTAEAQNALLKTLEEPPKGTFIILTAPSPHSILETIRSRCQVFDFSDKNEYSNLDINAQDIVEASLTKRFSIVEDILAKKRQEQIQIITSIFESLTQYYRDQLLEGHENLRTVDIIKTIEQTEYAFDKNVNTRLLLENLMIQLT